MTKSVMLKTTLVVLRLIEGGFTGYIHSNFNSCYLLLSDGNSIEVSVWGMDIAKKFECFSLAMDINKLPEGSVIPFNASKGNTSISVLLREDFIEPHIGDTSGLIGNNPVTHTSAKIGHVPEHALASCLTAYGVLIEGDDDHLVLAADWFPYNLIVTTDEAEAAKVLAEGEAVPVDRYIKKYGLPLKH